MKKKFGLIGFGTIGSNIFRRTGEERVMEVGFIFEPDQKKTESLDPSLLLTSFDDFEKRPVNLVVEAAVPQAVRELGPRILKNSDLLIFSLTSLADDDLLQEMEATAKTSGTRIYVPHGAILGLDGIHDGRTMIERVQITTTQSPKSLGLQDKGITQPVVVYEGSTRGACGRFPRNVNVHACLALTGLGFDKMHSKIIADPDAKSIAHAIEVTGKGLSWKIKVESIPTGGITGAYTPESAYQTVRRICVEEIGLQLA